MYGIHQAGSSQPTDKYGFVNEIEVRWATGIQLLMGIFSLTSILFWGLFTIPMIFVGIIWLDFIIKVFVGPGYSIFGNIVRPFIKNEYWVGAVQKRFAWSIGLFLSTFAFLCLLIVSGVLYQFDMMKESYEFVQTLPLVLGFQVPITPPLIACVICIIFMFLESVFGYCAGCQIYAKIVQWGWMKQIPGQNCPGGVCEVKF